MKLIPQGGEHDNVGYAVGYEQGPVMRRTAELAKYTDPGFAENYGGLSPAVKADIVLAQEGKLREMHRMLKQVDEKKTVLDASKDFENAAMLQPRLLELTKIQLNQDEAGRDMSAETCSLVAEYNGLVETISQALIGYDQALTKAEAAADANREKKRTS